MKCLLRDTLHIFRKSERPQSPEEAGNLFNLQKKLDLVIFHSGELEGLHLGEVTSLLGLSATLQRGVPPDLRIPGNMEGYVD